ncbi:hypothetical protein ALC56_10859 [Trachymyrmex septentrionalis]|uniref:Uncharacterized protein n=1 Tax=Trachymyrmex septentrionalis TaxID=34720 RepID=A0A195F3D0_9HYME|nr:hypothetical protein ALC56_10859 [Trachymyrmex septentrionalis]
MTYSASRDFRLTNQGLLKDHSHVLVVPDRPVTPPQKSRKLHNGIYQYSSLSAVILYNILLALNAILSVVSCRSNDFSHLFQKYVSEGSIVRDCVNKCVEKEAWSTRTYCCQQDGCNSGPSLTASSSTYFVLAISLAVFVVCRSLRG